MFIEVVYKNHKRVTFLDSEIKNQFKIGARVDFMGQIKDFLNKEIVRIKGVVAKIYKELVFVNILDSESKTQVIKACYNIEKKDFEWIE